MLRSEFSEPPNKICRFVHKKRQQWQVRSQYAIHRQLAFELSIEKRKIGFGFTGVSPGKSERTNAGWLCFDARILKSRIILMHDGPSVGPVCKVRKVR